MILCYTSTDMDLIAFVVIPAALACVALWKPDIGFLLMACYIVFFLTIEWLYKRSTGRDCTPSILEQILLFLSKKPPERD